MKIPDADTILKNRGYRLCLRCGKERIPKGRQKYCGSWRRSTGCSLIMHKEAHRKASRKWEKENRKYNPDKAKRKYRKISSNPPKRMIRYGMVYVLEGKSPKEKDI